MQKALSPGAIGVKAPNIEAAAHAARIGGYSSVEINPSEVVTRGVESARTALGEIAVAGFGIPFDWRGEESTWQAGLDALTDQAVAMAALGATRCSTWIMPMSDTLTLEENTAFHVARLTPIAAILADHGISLGLEFIGPKTMRDRGRYPFVHTMNGMLDLGRAIGPKVGLLLDAWHLYTSHGSADDVRKLTPDQVVYVHVNDAPDGLEIDAQEDHVRCLPGESGVIGLTEFLRALREIGYDGPVVCEPFKKELNDLPDDEGRR